MPSPVVPLDLLIGPERAAEFINGLVRDLMASDLLPETVAYRLVCEGVTNGDPFLLADPGQMWTLRPGHNGPAPARLFIAHRDVTQLTVDDEHGQRHGIPLCALADYQLDQWYWARTDQHST
ncbi:hypothetical protein ACFXPM_19225 [Streptomyces sp. NPDC059095]|uniref:hypothetical protein n=1 Tax=Streptomyces sp. NPDC059095 TaxID=3346726 RepID=UPI003688A6D8